MRTLCLALLAAGCFSKPPRPGASQVALEQVVALHYNAAAGSLVQQSSMLYATSPDDLIVAVVAANSTGLTGLAVTDSAGSSWQVAVVADCRPTQLAIAYTSGLPAATDVTVIAQTTSTSTYLGLALYEYSGIAAADVTAIACAPASPTMQIDVPPLQITRPDLVFAAYADTTVFSAVITPTPPMMTEESDSTFIYAAADDAGPERTGVLPGSYASSATDQRSTTTWAAAAVTFGVR